MDVKLKKSYCLELQFKSLQPAWWLSEHEITFLMRNFVKSMYKNNDGYLYLWCSKSDSNVCLSNEHLAFRGLEVLIVYKEIILATFLVTEDTSLGVVNAKIWSKIN